MRPCLRQTESTTQPERTSAVRQLPRLSRTAMSLISLLSCLSSLRCSVTDLRRIGASWYRTLRIWLLLGARQNAHGSRSHIRLHTVSCACCLWALPLVAPSGYVNNNNSNYNNNGVRPFRWNVRHSKRPPPPNSEHHIKRVCDLSAPYGRINKEVLYDRL